MGSEQSEAVVLLLRPSLSIDGVVGIGHGLAPVSKAMTGSGERLCGCGGRLALLPSHCRPQWILALVPLVGGLGFNPFRILFLYIFKLQSCGNRDKTSPHFLRCRVRTRTRV